MSEDNVHASTVAIGGRGVMILGASGAGKSDLALRLIDRGAQLVADDRTILSRDGDALLATCPATIAGRIEVRGLGILPVAHRGSARIALAVVLGEEDRLPEPRARVVAGVTVPEVTIDPRAPSAAIKVELALAELAA